MVDEKVINEILAEASLRAEQLEKAEAEADALNATAQELALREQALRAYVANGGSASTFDIEWPGLRREVIRQRTIAAMSEMPPLDVVDAFIAQMNAERA